MPRIIPREETIKKKAVDEKGNPIWTVPVPKPEKPEDPQAANKAIAEELKNITETVGQFLQKKEDPDIKILAETLKDQFQVFSNAISSMVEKQEAFNALVEKNNSLRYRSTAVRDERGNIKYWDFVPMRVKEH